MAPRIRGRSGAKRAMQNTNPVRPSQPASQIPGPTATKTVLNDGNLVYTPSPLDKKVREIENTIGQFVPDFIKDFGRQQEKKGFAEALIPGAVMNAPGVGGLIPRLAVGGAAEVIAPKVVPGKPVVDIGQTDQTVAPTRMADIRGSKTPGSMEPATTNVGEAKAMASAESSRSGAGYPAGVDKPLDYAPVADTVGGMKAGAPVPNMTYDSFMGHIGKDMDLNVRNPFESTNLPGTAKADSEVTLPKNGNEGEVLNAAKANEDDSRAVNLDPAESTEKTSRQRASQAFLTKGMNSIQALRHAEGEMGLISQGGRKFLRDPGQESGLLEINRDQYREIMDGGNIRAVLGENRGGAGPVAELSAAPEGFNKVSPMTAKTLGESDAFIPPSDSQDPIIAGSDNTPIDSETQLKSKARQFGNARLRMSGF